MNTYDYDKKAGYKYKYCQVCKKYKRCCQHHIQRGSSRHCSSIIWVCVFNGVTEGCHERIHREVKWAYENGYLERGHNSYQKKMKNKKCNHGAYIFDKDRGCMVCQWCRKPVDVSKVSQKKKTQPKASKSSKKVCQHTVTIFKNSNWFCQFCNKEIGEPRFGKSSKANDHIVGVNKKIKIGFEKQNPDIEKAEKMKRRYQELNLLIKRAKNDNERVKVLLQERDELLLDMRKLQDKFDNQDIE